MRRRAAVAIFDRMKSQPPPNPRTARELERAGRWPGETWGGNRPRQWAALGIFVAVLVLVAAVLALVG
jgi:hypothetical protein